ncbi:MAG: helix-turn-helix transcriptional regulator [Clostridia bacterium]|nr:helix-turn-helix transcriptional regulator [Clostridia bacterium]
MTFPVIDLRRTGRNIEQLRRESGLSVRQVQEYFGFEYPQAVYKWQHGESLPSVDNLLALAHLLGVRMEELLIYEDQELSSFVENTLPARSPTNPFFLTGHFSTTSDTPAAQREIFTQALHFPALQTACDSL